MARTIDAAYRAGWDWSARHDDTEATPAQADAFLRQISLPTDTPHTDVFCNGTIDQSRGDRWRLEYTPTSER